VVFAAKSLRRGTARYVFTPAVPASPAQRMDTDIGASLYYINARYKEVYIKRFIIYFFHQKCK